MKRVTARPVPLPLLAPCTALLGADSHIVLRTQAAKPSCACVPAYMFVGLLHTPCSSGWGRHRSFPLPVSRRRIVTIGAPR
jgi:hypothetical protein